MGRLIANKVSLGSLVSKIVRVWLLSTTLAGSLGFTWKSAKSFLIRSKSPSFIMHLSYLIGIIENWLVKTVNELNFLNSATSSSPEQG